MLTDISFVAVALAHLAVDILNAQRGLLLAAWSIPLGLTNAAIGLVSMLYSFAASLSQPAFGAIADRTGPRRLAVGGVVWMATCFGLALVVQGNWALALLILSALGSAAFHPAGTMESSEIGKVHYGGEVMTAASLFFLFGQAGYSVGPVIGGVLIGEWGPIGLLLLVPVALSSGVFAANHFQVAKPAPRQEGQPILRFDTSLRWTALTAFILVVAFGSWSQTNMITFLPKYYSDAGFSAASYGLIAALFMGASAVAGVAGGRLGDRLGGRMVTVWSLVLGALPLALYPRLGLTPWAYLLAPLAGGLTGFSHTILVVQAQSMMPGSSGAASGLILGFMFASGAVGTLISGIQADRSGFDAMFLTTAAITLMAGILALAIPRDLASVPAGPAEEPLPIAHPAG
ncbi:MAG: MFS transporter [Anaerolineales bacterium]|nr:MFS transporter [Anaerolineales bacterium]